MRSAVFHFPLDLQDVCLEGIPDSERLLILAWGPPHMATASTFGAIRRALPKASLLACAAAPALRGDIECDQITVLAIALERGSFQVNVAQGADHIGVAKVLAKNTTQSSGAILMANSCEAGMDGLVKALGSVLPNGLPLVGGVAASVGKGSWLRVGDLLVERGAALVSFQGVQFAVAHGCGHTPQLGQVMRAGGVKGGYFRFLNRKPALGLLLKAVGIKTAPKNIPVSIGGTQSENIRNIFNPNDTDPGLKTNVDLHSGEVVLPWGIQRYKMIQAAREAGSTLKGAMPTPEAILVVSCVARQEALGSMSRAEIETLTDRWPRTPLAGWRGHGELSHDHSGPLHLNHHIVVAGMKEE